MSFAPEHKYVKEFFSTKSIVIFNSPANEIAELNDKFAEEDLKYIKRAILLPAQYENREAVCLISFSADNNLALAQIIEQLNIHGKAENSEVYAM
jgi:hypothetical protein